MDMLQHSEIITIKGEKIAPILETALAMMQCDRENPAYDELKAIYYEQKNTVEELIDPRGIFCEGVLLRKGSNEDLPVGRKVIYAMSTLGPDICDYIDKCMQDDLLKGLMIDFMADSCMFAFGNQMQNAVKEYCKSHGIGVSRTYEPPELVPMECQKDAFDILDAGNNLGLSITGGYMLKPVKSMGRIYTLSENPDEFNTEHDCSNCLMNNCPMRGM